MPTTRDPVCGADLVTYGPPPPLQRSALSGTGIPSTCDIPPFDGACIWWCLLHAGNECVAKCANVLIRTKKGECPSCKIKVGNCICNPLGYRPVCSFGLTFSNTCDALCGGYACPMTPGVCR